MSAKIVTIERHILDQQSMHPQATGAFTNLLYDIALAAKMIARETTRAGLVDILGRAGAKNVHEEDQQKLDVYSHETIVRLLDYTGRLSIMASEESVAPIPIPSEYPSGNYALLFDPLDGSSNIDYNVSIGTIFSIYRKISASPRGDLADLLQPGIRQAAAGYVVYGSSTMLVYTTGQGAHGFTLDPSVGEFLLSHPDIRIPEHGHYLSVNSAYEEGWTEPVRALMRRYRGLDGKRKAMSVRYVGSMVADFHRNLLGGGIFAYPPNQQSPNGKLRLLYECNPLAFICEQAGGAAIDGTRRILDIVPRKLHERTPIYVGSKADVEIAREMLAGAAS
jgi:fructose-1,6-bisphosphatase I